MARRSVLRWATVTVLTLVVGAHSRSAHAVDTLEPFELGASDVEAYLGADGFGRATEERSVSGEFLAGYGLTENISAYFGTVLAGNGALANGSHALYLGAYGNFVNTDHFDFDLILEVAEGEGAFGLNGAVELNFDLEPDLALAGLFLNLGVSTYGQGDGAGWQVDVDIPFLVGAYWAVAPDHQLLVSYSAAWVQSFRSEQAYGVGDVALGYNVNLVENFELITEAFVTLPDDGLDTAFGASVGFLVTMP